MDKRIEKGIRAVARTGLAVGVVLLGMGAYTEVRAAEATTRAKDSESLESIYRYEYNNCLEQQQNCDEEKTILDHAPEAIDHYIETASDARSVGNKIVIFTIGDLALTSGLYLLSRKHRQVPSEQMPQPAVVEVS